MERADEIRGHPGWHFLVVTGDDVIPFDGPEIEDDLPAW
jgi:hypothetical protein